MVRMNDNTTMVNRKTILWLEDETDQAALMAKTFHENGYNTIVVDNAEDGLEMLTSITPDLLLVDIKLSGIDGIQFFKTVKQIEHLQHVPFIYLTAYNSLAMAIEAKKLGATDYITKPFDVEYLLERIKEVLSQD